jgi:hypothetical protein
MVEMCSKEYFGSRTLVRWPVKIIRESSPGRGDSRLGKESLGHSDGGNATIQHQHRAITINVGSLRTRRREDRKKCCCIISCIGNTCLPEIMKKRLYGARERHTGRSSVPKPWSPELNKTETPLSRAMRSRSTKLNETTSLAPSFANPRHTALA